MKKAYNEYKRLSAENDKIMEAWENDIENEELEKAFDNSYKAYYKAFENLIKAIVVETNGKISEEIARLMITNSKFEQLMETI